jgi:hypothetical protein
LEVLEKRLCFVLRQNEGRGDVRVDEVAQNEIDDSILPSEWYGWFAPLRRERVQSLAPTAGEDQRQNPCIPLEAHR